MAQHILIFDDDEDMNHRPHRIITNRPDCFETLNDLEFVNNYR